MDVLLVVLTWAAIAGGAWMALSRSRGIDRTATRGLRLGALYAVLVGVGGGLLIGVSFYGRQFLGGPVDLPAAMIIGTLGGGALTVVYSALGMVTLPLGLLIGFGRRWAVAGAWLAVPLVAVALFYILSAILFAEPGRPIPPTGPTPPPAG